MNMRNWKIGLLAVTTAFASLATQAQAPSVTSTSAAMPALIPVETFMRRGEFGSMAISPKGDRLAATVPFKGRDNLVVVDLEKKTRNIITSFEKDDVISFNWINNDRIVLRVADGRDDSAWKRRRGIGAS